MEIYNIAKDSILLFDLDGTLIDSDYANFLAYKKAFDIVLKQDYYYFEFDIKHRFSRKDIINIKQDISESAKDEIISLKEEFFSEFLNHTKINNSLLEILIAFKNTNRLFLVTNANPKRVHEILEFHNLTNYFTCIYTNLQVLISGIDCKYQSIISTYKLDANKITLFENEDNEINCALLSGVPEKNIFKI